MVACALLAACDDAEDEPQAQAIGLATASRPAPNPQKESLSIVAPRSEDLPTTLPNTPHFELFSQYSGQDIRQVIGVSGRTLWLCFTAPWCKHCKDMINELRIVAREEKGSVQVIQLNVDEYPAIATEFGIKKIPTTILYTEGVKLRTIVGSYNASSLRSYLHRVLAREDADNSILERIVPSTLDAAQP